MDGFGILPRDEGRLPPSFRNLLNKVGNEKVTSITLVRTPLSEATSFLLNLASFGQLKSALKSSNIDKLFHLSMLINGKYILEKNEVLSFKTGNNIKSGSESLEVPIKGDFTIQELIDKTRSFMGDKNFTIYDAKTINCSNFISSVLRANGLNNDNASTFVNQKTVELFDGFPKLSKLIVDLGTNLGAVADRQIQGEGEAPFMYNFGLKDCKMIF